MRLYTITKSRPFACWTFSALHEGIRARVRPQDLWIAVNQVDLMS